MLLRDGTETQDPRLDRLVQFDERSRDYPVRALVDPAKPRSYTWRCPIRLNQGNLGACVSFAWHHELGAKPVQVQNLTNEIARSRYCDMQNIDGWQGHSSFCGPPGPYYEGTSVLAGAQLLKAQGYFTEYRWAFGLDDLILAVGYKGPAVLGINWYQGMMATGASGYIRPVGQIVGGHAILCNRVNVKAGFFGLANSWGQDWGVKDAWGMGGSCRLSFQDMAQLLSEDGEACIPSGRAL